MKTTVSEKGQITVPKAIRTKLGLRPGTVLEMTIVDGRLVATKEENLDPISLWKGRGTLPNGYLTTDDYLAEVRG